MQMHSRAADRFFLFRKRGAQNGVSCRLHLVETADRGIVRRGVERFGVLMREAGKRMNALALHFYCGSGKKKQLAAEFDEGDWFVLLQKALKMDELIKGHSAIMDKYDPEKKVALFVDEWGTWHQVEPGTNPGFLYQQNTMRDALAAALTFNIFNQNAARVKMANIAQTVNVLQAMVLTDGPKMLLTPTYHVF